MLSSDELYKRRETLSKRAELIQTERQRQLVCEALATIDAVLAKFRVSHISVTDVNPTQTKEVFRTLAQTGNRHCKGLHEAACKEVKNDDATEEI